MIPPVNYLSANACNEKPRCKREVHVALSESDTGLNSTASSYMALRIVHMNSIPPDHHLYSMRALYPMHSNYTLVLGHVYVCVICNILCTCAYLQTAMQRVYCSHTYLKLHYVWFHDSYITCMSVCMSYIYLFYKHTLYFLCGFTESVFLQA